MYDALAREHVHMEQAEIRRRVEAASRLPRRWEIDEAASANCERRHRWPRLHRASVR